MDLVRAVNPAKGLRTGSNHLYWPATDLPLKLRIPGAQSSSATYLKKHSVRINNNSRVLMKRIVLCTLAALLLFAEAPWVMADVITLNVTGTLAPDKGIASCAPTCTLGGNIVIDNTLGTVVSANVSVTGETPTEGPFTTWFPFLGSGGGIPGANTTLEIDDAASDALRFYISTPTSASLVGYTGGPAIKILMTNIFADVTADQRADWTGTGALTNSAVPEPSSLLLLASGGLGLANALRRKLSR